MYIVVRMPVPLVVFFLYSLALDCRSVSACCRTALAVSALRLIRSRHRTIIFSRKTVSPRVKIFVSTESRMITESRSTFTFSSVSIRTIVRAELSVVVSWIVLEHDVKVCMKSTTKKPTMRKPMKAYLSKFGPLSFPKSAFCLGAGVGRGGKFLFMSNKFFNGRNVYGGKLFQSFLSE